MHKILFVGLDTTTMTTISEFFGQHKEKFTVQTAGSFREVPNLIAGMNASMVVVDLKMPDVDDLQLLDYLCGSHPKLPFIVTTAFGADGIEGRVRSHENCRYYAKPVDIEKLTEAIFDELEASVGGQIQGIGLSSFLQMSEMEKTTAKLVVRSGTSVGFLYLHKGELIDAQLGAYDGLDAAHEIVSWEDAVIEIRKAEKRKKTISMPLMNILMEGLRIKDEKEAKQKEEEAARGTASDMVAEARKAVASAAEESLKIADAETGDGAAAETKAKVASAAEGRAPKVKAAPAVSRRRRIVRFGFLLFFLLLLGIGGLYAWQQIVRPMMVEKEFDRVLQEVGGLQELEKKVLRFESYIESHPNSPYEMAAKKRIADIRLLIEERDYEWAISSVDRLPIDAAFETKSAEIYSRYLEKHPLGRHAPEIKKRMSETQVRIDTHDFNVLKKVADSPIEKRLEAYRGYLDKHPQGAHRGDVRAMQLQLGETYYQKVLKDVQICDKKSDWAACLKSTETFLDSFEGHRRYRAVELVHHRIAAEQDLAELSAKAKKQGGSLKDIRQIYTDYLKANPGTPLEARISKEISKIDKRISEEELWRKMSTYAMNRTVDVFERMETFEGYMADSASIRYRNPAKRILAELKKEKQAEIKRRQMAAEERKKEAAREAARKRELARIQGEKRKVTAALRQAESRFSIDSEDTAQDRRTGLTWVILDSKAELGKCLTYDEAKAYVDGLNAGGYQDWRMPTTSELMVILNNRPGFPGGGTAWYWSSESYWKGYHEIVKIVTRKREDQWAKEETDMKQCGVVRAVRP